MDKSRYLLAGVVGLGLFAAGYLTGRQSSKDVTATPVSTNRNVRLAGGQDSPMADRERARTRSARRPTDEKKGGYRKLFEMVSEGKLQLDGVRINNENFLPDRNVAEFFGLSEEQVAEMKLIGLERLRKRQDREHGRAIVQEVSETGIVFDLPPDPEFAAAEAAAFVEDLSRAFGPEVAAMLQPSVEQAYQDSKFPSHVRYVLTPRPLPEAAENASEEIREMLKGQYEYTISSNQNEDGSYMTDKRGNSMGNGWSSGGGFNLRETSPETARPRFHYMWERTMGRK